jgi:hypothetical protein
MSNVMNQAKVVSISTLETEPLLTVLAINLKLLLLLRVGHEVEGMIICIPMCHAYNTFTELWAWVTKVSESTNIRVIVIAKVVTVMMPEQNYI